MSFKYLSDGRKVVVIGKLNNEESIVQEIFVSASGDEVPSGERFVTKSLHNEPVKSWKEKQLDDYEKRKKACEAELNKIDARIRDAQTRLEEATEHLKQVNAIKNNIKESDLDLFVGFISGTIQYVVCNSYEIEPPQKLADILGTYDNFYSGAKKFDGLKLLSVLGKSDGNLMYRINRYRDGSGGDTEIYPFTTYAAAINKIKEIAVSKIEAGRLSEKCFDTCIDLGITFDSLTLEKHKEAVTKSLDTTIASENENFRKVTERIEFAKQKLADLDDKLAKAKGEA